MLLPLFTRCWLPKGKDWSRPAANAHPFNGFFIGFLTVLSLSPVVFFNSVSAFSRVSARGEGTGAMTGVLVFVGVLKEPVAVVSSSAGSILPARCIIIFFLA